jgi:hypothetical protein
VSECECPECPVCGTRGDPKCHVEHGLVYTPKQLQAQAEYEAYFKDEAEMEARLAEEFRDLDTEQEAFDRWRLDQDD